MSKIKSIFRKKGFITALILDVMGLLISFLVNANLTNLILVKIALFCYCIRFELITLFILLILFYIYYYFSEKYSDTFKYSSVSFSLPILAALAFYYIPIRQFMKARYYYFNNNYYIDESQQYFFDKALECVDNKEWENSLRYFELAKKLYPNAYNIEKINDFERESELYIMYCSQLYDSYIKPSLNHIYKNAYDCAKVLHIIYPTKYDYIYRNYNDSIKKAIEAYPSIYESCKSGDYQECRSLILRYGWLWFEPILYEKLSYDYEDYVMKHLKEYLSHEDPHAAQCRIISSWISKDSISNYIK